MFRFCLTFDQTEVGEVIYNTVHGFNLYERLVSSLGLHTCAVSSLKLPVLQRGGRRGGGGVARV